VPLVLGGRAVPDRVVQADRLRPGGYPVVAQILPWPPRRCRKAPMSTDEAAAYYAPTFRIKPRKKT
jgi:hypothetical protein